jgi:hypothetical protein
MGSTHIVGVKEQVTGVTAIKYHVIAVSLILAILLL